MNSLATSDSTTCSLKIEIAASFVGFGVFFGFLGFFSPSRSGPFLRNAVACGELTLPTSP